MYIPRYAIGIVTSAFKLAKKYSDFLVVREDRKTAIISAIYGHSMLEYFLPGVAMGSRTGFKVFVKEMIGILKNTRGDVTMHDEGTHISVRDSAPHHNKWKFSWQLYKWEPYNSRKDMQKADGGVAKVDPMQFLTMLDDVRKCITKEQHRYDLEYCKIDIYNNSIKAIATSGKILATSKADTTFCNYEKDVEFYLSAKDIVFLRSAIRKSQKIDIWANDDYVRICSYVGNDPIFRFGISRAFIVRFPNYTIIKKYEETATDSRIVQIDILEIKRILKAVFTYTEPDKLYSYDNPCEITFEDGKLRVGVKNKHTSNETFDVEGEVSFPDINVGEPIKFTINAKLLYQALSRIRKRKAVLWYSKEKRMISVSNFDADSDVHNRYFICTIVNT